MCSSRAAARQQAIETGSTAFAPRILKVLPAVPSSSWSFSSIARWSRTGMPISAGAMIFLIFSRACSTPLPRKALGSLSRSSRASCIPVDAPEGHAARNTPSWVVSSTSVVGVPRESMIMRALIALIVDGASIYKNFSKVYGYKINILAIF
eukprot:XP_001709337.1 Hypothetical protein GL50803_20276 [Giardia lamblia ATCC 50803]